MENSIELLNLSEMNYIPSIPVQLVNTRKRSYLWIIILVLIVIAVVIGLIVNLDQKEIKEAEV